MLPPPLRKSQFAENEMMHRRSKIVCVIGTRPEAVKLAPIIHRLRDANWADVCVVATAQHRGLLDQVLRFFGIEPDVDLDLMRRNQSLAQLTQRLLGALDDVLGAEQPQIVLAQGDTTTVMVSALCSFYRRILFGHVEAGLRTGDRHSPYPEEMYRVLVGKLGDLHFAPTADARDNLVREGAPPNNVFLTGNTVVDALRWATRQPLPEVFPKNGATKRVLVTAHRRENFGKPLEEICETIKELASLRDVSILFPVHPNPNVRSVIGARLSGHPSICLCPPLEYPRFVSAMNSADLILTDSGGVQEEAPSLGKPLLVLRDTTERPEGVRAGVACLVGHSRDAILKESLRLLDDPSVHARMADIPNPYGDGHAAGRIISALKARVFELSEAPPSRLRAA